MELWIPITIAAAFLQNLRSAMQKHLKGVMGTTGATFVRFGFGFPFALVSVWALSRFAGYSMPQLHASFAIWAAVGGIAQIVATFLLVHLFSLRNFAVGTAYSKTEPVQAAIFGLVLLGETVSAGAVMAILVGVAGVMLISMAHTPLNLRSLIAALVSRSALIGLASGAAFGVSAVAYRSASLSLGGPNFIMQAAVTLACVTVFQTLVMLAWMVLRERDEIGRVLAAWRPALVVGLSGVAASACWFMAMTLERVAYVRALGQIELVFTFFATVFVFREKINRLEVAGSVLIVAGIILLLSAR